MSASNRIFFYITASLAVVLPGAGCSKEVKADFPRPPATASIPPPVDEPVAEVAEAAPEPVIAEPEQEPEPDPEPLPPPQTSRPPRSSRPAPEEEVREATPTEPPSTQLAGGPPVDQSLASKLERASSLLGSIGRRDLTPGQTEQYTAAKAFVTQAQKALEEGDQRRALVLIDKGLILALDVERVSRP